MTRVEIIAIPVQHPVTSWRWIQQWLQRKQADHCHCKEIIHVIPMHQWMHWRAEPSLLCCIPLCDIIPSSTLNMHFLSDDPLPYLTTLTSEHMVLYWLTHGKKSPNDCSNSSVYALRRELTIIPFCQEKFSPISPPALIGENFITLIFCPILIIAYTCTCT